MVESKQIFSELEKAAAYKMRGFVDKHSICVIKQCEKLQEVNGDVCIFCGVKNCEKLLSRLTDYYRAWSDTLAAVRGLPYSALDDLKAGKGNLLDTVWVIVKNYWVMMWSLSGDTSKNEQLFDFVKHERKIKAYLDA